MTRPPLPILIVCCLFGLLAVQALLAAVGGLGGLTSLNLAELLFSLGLSAFGLAGLFAMRRWGPLVLLALIVLATLPRVLNAATWWKHYPIMGPFVGMWANLILLSPVPFYWRRMSWAWLSQQPKPLSRPADVF